MRTINTLKLSLLGLLLITFVNLDAQPNKALSFSSKSHDNVDLGSPANLNNLTPSGSFTIMVWFKMASGKDGLFLSKSSDDGNGNIDNEFTFGYDESNKVFAVVGNDTIQSSTTGLDDDQWHHAAVTSDGTDFTLYVDGMPELTGTNGTQNAVNVEWVIGARDTADGGNEVEDPLDGELDEMRIFNTELTESEITDIMGHEIDVNHTGLVSYYRMNTKDDGSVKDFAGNNDGQRNGANVLETSTAPVGDASLYAISDDDITHTSDVWMDIGLSEESSSYSYVAMQIDSTPDYQTGMTYVADHYWNIWASDPDFGGTFTATLTFHYDNLTGIQDETKLQLFTRDDATHIDWTEITDTTLNTEGDNTDGKGSISITLDENSVSGGDDFRNNYILASEDPDNPLPVEFGAITAVWQDEEVKLDWLTYTETNNSHFVVERSINAEDFEEAGTVEGSGTRADISEYTFTDRNAVADQNLYYRLKQVDFNGASSYSEVIDLRASNLDNGRIYPSLATNTVTFEIDGEYTLSIYNIQGKLMMKKELSGYTDLDVSDLPEGAYLYKIHTSEEFRSGKFVKQ